MNAKNRLPSTQLAQGADPAALRLLPDLAVRTLGGAVVYANDEAFAEREALIRPEPSTFQPRTFGAKGQVYDGWETRRRRDQGGDRHDFAIVRLGAAGVVRAVVVDTAHFTGNYPPEISVEAAFVAGHPSVEELLAVDWHRIVPRSPVKGDSENPFVVTSARRWTHVRLNIYPDGGVARLRVHGEVVADPELLEALDVLDLAALEHGGRVVDCSNRFYGSPDRLIAPGLARSIGEGWETARRRDEGNDWVLVRLAVPGVVRVAEVDASWFIGNAPGWAALSSYDEGAGAEPQWSSVLERTPLQPDTRHRFLVSDAPAATHVRLDVYPDGGMARLRLWGRPTPQGMDALRQRWAGTGST
jgi:allantoicase